MFGGVDKKSNTPLGFCGARSGGIQFDTVRRGCYNGFVRAGRCDDMEPFTWWDRLKAELRSFTSDAGGKMMIFMLVLGIVVAIFMFWVLARF